MMQRRAAVALLVCLIAACDSAESKLTPEQQFRRKYGDSECFVSGRNDLPPALRKWHSRESCPELQSCSTIPAGKTVAPILVRPQLTGLVDGKGQNYDVEHCPKCVY
ncbi:MAG: hypothetical protein JO332_02920 [Planctomycetaceae bacterium]|nr:hypothetical protein [Planctomycetaceae bacterium]